MRIGAFEIDEPVPDITGAHALAVLRPWIDAGSVGTLVLSWLESHFRAEVVGRLARPGNFFDFTRYRPTMHFTKGGRREVTIPNTVVRYAGREDGIDLLFLHVLEPHMLGETYVDSLLRLMERFNVQRYCLIGAMYDMVPHTRPCLVTGGSVGAKAEETLRQANVRTSNYEGPTTITYLISQRAPELGMDTMSLIVHLPHYAQFEQNYMGVVRLMEVLSPLYGLPVDRGDADKAEDQRRELDDNLDKEPSLKSVVAQLEGYYDARTDKAKEDETATLSPEIERFLQDINRRFTDT